jgi:hypothetical protein
MQDTENFPSESNSMILFYQTEDGKSRIKVKLEEGTVWLTQAMISELYQTSKQNISLHINNILKDEELDSSTVKEYLTVQPEGKRDVQRKILFYNLDMILAVGYRVQSHRGTQFRKWATEHLREYLIKGFVLDDERLREGRTAIGTDYFDELLERIRDIRASEKRFYQKILDLFKLSIDYDPRSEPTREFFKIAQNKLHWAITHHTAAEIIAERADSNKPNMGLTSWKGTKVRKSDVSVAKNYLKAEEIQQLNRIVTMYLDYAESQAERKQPMYMKDWRQKLDAFLQFNERDILHDSGRVSMEIANHLAETEYEKFSKRRLLEETNEDDETFEKIAKQIEDKQ